MKKWDDNPDWAKIYKQLTYEQKEEYKFHANDNVIDTFVVLIQKVSYLEEEIKLLLRPERL